MEGGTLANWLHSKSSSPNPPPPPSTASPLLLLAPPSPPSLPDRRSLAARLRMALGVAQGMCAFEQARPHPLLHRDLKPSNVLLDAAGRPRVADAGLARALAPGDAPGLTGETGTYLYMSPEVFAGDRPYGPRADVWSFGVLLAELVSGRRPYEEHLLTPAQVAMEVAAGRLRPALPPGAPPAAAALAAACLDLEPQLRPPFSSLVPALARLAAEQEAAEREAGAAAAEGGGGARDAAAGLLNRLWGGAGSSPRR
jgi:serine/threonine protein kinase